MILNYQHQKIWKDTYTLFSYSANSSSPSIPALIVLADIELKKGNYAQVLRIAEKLKQKNKDSSMAIFFEASVQYHLNKKEAIKLLLRIKPLLKPSSNQNSDINYRHMKVLDMLIVCYYSVGDKQKAMECINDILSSKKLSRFQRFMFQGLKADYQKNHKSAAYWFKKAMELQLDNKNVQKCKIL